MICIHCGYSEADIGPAKCGPGPRNQHQFEKRMTRLQTALKELRENILEAEEHLKAMEPNQEYWLDRLEGTGHVVGFVEMDHAGGKSYKIVCKEAGGKCTPVVIMPIMQQLSIFDPKVGVLEGLYRMVDKSTNGHAAEVERVIGGIEAFLKKGREDAHT